MSKILSLAVSMCVCVDRFVAMDNACEVGNIMLEVLYLETADSIGKVICVHGNESFWISIC